jgi:hypothetical protein
MGRGRLPLAKALRYATQVAACLRDLHRQGLVYGAVSSQLILLGPRGATLRNSGTSAQLGDPRRDVAAFGAVLSEILRRVEGPERLCAEIQSLALLCQDQTVDMRQALIGLRLLGLQAEQITAAARRLAKRPRGSGRLSAVPALSGK